MELHYLTAHFSLEELTASNFGLEHFIPNDPPVKVISNLQNLCQRVLEPLRRWYGNPIYVISGYRNRFVNVMAGSSEESLHRTGEAADLLVPSAEIGLEWIRFIRRNLEYDTLVLNRHHGTSSMWLHASCRWNPLENRCVVLNRT